MMRPRVSRGRIRRHTGIVRPNEVDQPLTPRTASSGRVAPGDFAPGRVALRAFAYLTLEWTDLLAVCRSPSVGVTMHSRRSRPANRSVPTASECAVVMTSRTTLPSTFDTYWYETTSCVRDRARLPGESDRRHGDRCAPKNDRRFHRN